MIPSFSRSLARRLVAPALGLSLVVAAGCVSQEEVNRPVHDELAVAGRVLGFALDARIEVLELKLALLKRDPALAATLGSEAQVLAKLDRVRADQRAIEEEIRRLKTVYPIGEGVK